MIASFGIPLDLEKAKPRMYIPDRDLRISTNSDLSSYSSIAGAFLIYFRDNG